MATAKTVNYTAEQENRMVSLYSANPCEETVNTLAVEMGKTIRSVIAKLSRLGIYQKKEYKTKTGESVQKKDGIADAIGSILGFTEAECESLAKANKTALEKIFKALANSKPI